MAWGRHLAEPRAGCRFSGDGIHWTRWPWAKRSDREPRKAPAAEGMALSSTFDSMASRNQRQLPLCFIKTVELDERITEIAEMDALRALTADFSGDGDGMGVSEEMAFVVLTWGSPIEDAEMAEMGFHQLQRRLSPISRAMIAIAWVGGAFGRLVVLASSNWAGRRCRDCRDRRPHCACHRCSWDERWRDCRDCCSALREGFVVVMALIHVDIDASEIAKGLAFPFRLACMERSRAHPQALPSLGILNSAPLDILPTRQSLCLNQRQLLLFRLRTCNLSTSPMKPSSDGPSPPSGHAAPNNAANSAATGLAPLSSRRP